MPRAVLPATQAWSPEGGRTASTGRLLPRACDADPGGPAFLRPDWVRSPGGLQELAVDSEETVRGSAPPPSPPSPRAPAAQQGPLTAFQSGWARRPGTARGPLGSGNALGSQQLCLPGTRARAGARMAQAVTPGGWAP